MVFLRLKRTEKLNSTYIGTPFPLFAQNLMIKYGNKHLTIYAEKYIIYLYRICGFDIINFAATHT